MRHWIGVLVIGALPGIVGNGYVRAQGTSEQAPGRYVFTRATHQRWIGSAQRDSSVDWIDTFGSIRIDSVSDVTSVRTFFLSSLGYDARFTVRADGRVSRTEASVTPSRFATVARSGMDTMSITRNRLYDSGVRYLPLLPSFRMLDVAIPFHPDVLAKGGRWSDGIAAHDSASGIVQTMGGRRWNVIVGDTTVRGRHLWIVRDSAKVSITESIPTDDVVGGIPVRLARVATGVVRGTSLYDVEWRLFVARTDTARLRGSVTHYFPGRTYVSSARFERSRAYILEDSATYRARVSAQYKRPSLEEAQTQSRATAVLRRRPVAEFIAAGDTTAAFAQVLNGYGETTDLASARLIIAALNDPSIAIRFNARMDYIVGDVYVYLVEGLPAITADTARWGCHPAACALLAAQWRKARDPRLRDLALAMHVALDPARWADTLRAWKSDSRELREIRELVEGVGANWPAAARLPVPPRGASFAAWEQWMNGLNATYAQRAFAGRDTLNRAHPGVRFNESHEVALRFQQKMTGRDFVQEFDSMLSAAGSDTAKLVFRTMLIGIHAYSGNADAVAARLLRGSSIDRQSAEREAVYLLDRSAAASQTLADSLQDALLGFLFDDIPAWPMLPPATHSFLTSDPPRAGDSVFIQVVHMSATLRAKWEARARVVTDKAFKAPWDRIPVSYYSIGDVRAIGPFASITFDSAYRTPGAPPAPAPGAFGTGGTIYLVRTFGGWAILSMSIVVT